MTIPVSQKRSTGMRVPAIVTRPAGSTDGTTRPPPPVMRSIVACAMRSTPSDATSFDSGDELRSGRNTTSCTTTPIATVARSASAIAGAVASGEPPRSVRSHRNR